MSNELIKKWEQFRAEPYKCAAGVPTIGYGTTFYPNGNKVSMGDGPVSEATATQYLDEYIIRNINPVIKENVHVPLNSNQRKAIESLIYNIGPAAFKKSTLLKKLNAGDFDGAALQFLEWITGGGRMLRGLVRRRAEEMLLFLTPSYKSLDKAVRHIEEPKANWLEKFINLLRS